MRIEIDLRSGRPNPSWDAEGREETELLERLAPRVPRTPGNGGGGDLPSPPALGYRGFVLSAGRGWDEDLRVRVFAGSLVWSTDPLVPFRDEARLEELLIGQAVDRGLASRSGFDAAF